MSGPDPERPWWEVHALGALLIALALALLGLMAWNSRLVDDDGGPPPTEAAAPPDLAPFAAPFREGVDALEQGDADRAVGILSSFSFGDRPVEQYRLFYLARAND